MAATPVRRRLPLLGFAVSGFRQIPAIGDGQSGFVLCAWDCVHRTCFRLLTRPFPHTSNVFVEFHHGGVRPGQRLVQKGSECDRLPVLIGATDERRKRRDGQVAESPGPSTVLHQSPFVDGRLGRGTHPPGGEGVLRLEEDRCKNGKKIELHEADSTPRRKVPQPESAEGRAFGEECGGGGAHGRFLGRVGRGMDGSATFT